MSLLEPGDLLGDLIDLPLKSNTVKFSDEKSGEGGDILTDLPKLHQEDVKQPLDEGLVLDKATFGLDPMNYLIERLDEMEQELKVARLQAQCYKSRYQLLNRALEVSNAKIEEVIQTKNYLKSLLAKWQSGKCVIDNILNQPDLRHKLLTALLVGAPFAFANKTPNVEVDNLD